MAYIGTCLASGLCRRQNKQRVSEPAAYFIWVEELLSQQAKSIQYPVQALLHSANVPEMVICHAYSKAQ